ncbi:MAG: NAD(P)/FAD-dependent oxidoreductase [Acidimicrobiales bacterium]
MATSGTNQFDVAVVGGGMIGSAAARHLAEAGLSVVVVTAPEPDETDLSSTAGPFSSHADAARITRVIDSDPIWAGLAAASIARYEDLETRSGIRFHDPVGLVWAKLAETSTGAVDDAASRGADVRPVSPRWVLDNTGIAIPENSGQTCVFEGAPAGLVDPRRLVQAELTLAIRAGAAEVEGPATGLRQMHGSVRVSGPFGEVQANRVLLASGMYGAELLDTELELIRWPRTIVRAEIDCPANLPSLIVEQVDRQHIDHIYWTPPVRYPDGRIMLKIGGTHATAQPLQRVEQIAEWFQSGGSEDEAADLRATIDGLLPGATVHSWEAVPCVVTKTPTGYPHVGWIDDHVAVAVAGNGSAAKSCDEIGRLASLLFTSHPSTEPNLDRFKPVIAAAS